MNAGLYYLRVVIDNQRHIVEVPELERFAWQFLEELPIDYRSKVVDSIADARSRIRSILDSLIEMLKLSNRQAPQAIDA